jgi:5-methylcytosine-specific restriction protein B
MEKIDRTIQYIKELTYKFGANEESYILRNNTNPEALNDNGAFIGIISNDEPKTGPYQDFSVVLIPSKDEKPWLICIGVGSNGFKNDFELANSPGIRRRFVPLISSSGFVKSDFSDIETPLPKIYLSNENISHLKNTLKRYSKVLPVVEIIKDPENEDGRNIIAAFIATYAELRSWPTNKEHRIAKNGALEKYIRKQTNNEVDEISALLKERKYIVLQGPPGTGKTRITESLANKLKAKIFITQFHAETSYSDFICGIRPLTLDGKLHYQEKIGIFVEAIIYAKDNKEQNVLLIIDEINRANLSNVLGPVFYLFEHKSGERTAEIEISIGNKINCLPSNFYVVATMNTADRSLAVVDFALRRRFAWYTMYPKEIKFNNYTEQQFFNNDFQVFKEIFEWYGKYNELLMQPGQGYFIAKNEDEMKQRIQYELLPLVQEYLLEGIMTKAQEEFNKYFMDRIGVSIIK